MAHGSAGGIMRAARSAGFRALFRMAAPFALRETWQHLVLLRAMERADTGVLLERQEARLRGLIAWAHSTVPYYERIMRQAGVSPSDISGIEDLRALPILRRSDIRAAATDMISRCAGPGDWFIKSTSGTTGQPLRIYRDRRTFSFEQATIWHSHEWAGATPVDRWLMVTAPANQHGRSNITRWKRLCGGRLVPFEPLVGMQSQPVLATLDATAPEVIRGVPSLLGLLAQIVLREGYRLPERPRCLLYTGEHMSEEVRGLIGAAFGAPIFSVYGANELAGVVAQTCEFGRLHLNTEGFIVEVADGQPGDRQGAPAARGRLLITDLRNRVMPIIRYEVGDAGVVGDGAGCPCGRTLPLLGGLEGRIADLIVTPSGRRLPVTLLRQPARRYQEIFGEYQFRQERPDELVMLLVPTDGFTREAAQGLARVLESALYGEVVVHVEAVERIAREPSGKRPLLKTTLVNLDDTLQRRA